MLFKGEAKFWAHIETREVVVADADVICILNLQLVFSFRLKTNHKHIHVFTDTARVLAEAFNEISFAQVVQPYKLGLVWNQIFYGKIVDWKKRASTCFLLDLSLRHKLRKKTREAFECSGQSNVWIYFNRVALLRS